MIANLVRGSQGDLVPERLPCVKFFQRPEVESCEYIGMQGVYWSKGNKIYRSDDINSPLHFVCSIDLTLRNRLFSSCRIGRRLWRKMFYNIRPLSDGAIFFSYGNDIGIYKDGVTFYFEGRKVRSKILRGGYAILPNGDIVFGDYFSNSARGEVAIYRLSSKIKKLKVEYVFPPGAIRHVHSVSWDPYTSRVMVATGDLNSECYLLSFDKDFKEKVELGGGNEMWRTISPQYGKNAIYFGTDAQYLTNSINRYDRETKRLDILSEVNGPIFYSAQLASGFLFGSTIEMCPSQKSPEAILYYLDAETEKVHVLDRFSKDLFNRKLFQMGVINLPVIGKPVDMVPVSGVALNRIDGKFFLVANA